MIYDQFIYERVFCDIVLVNLFVKLVDLNVFMQMDFNVGFLYKMVYNLNSKDFGEGDQLGSGMIFEMVGQMFD